MTEASSPAITLTRAPKPSVGSFETVSAAWFSVKESVFVSKARPPSVLPLLKLAW